MKFFNVLCLSLLISGAASAEFQEDVYFEDEPSQEEIFELNEQDKNDKQGYRQNMEEATEPNDYTEGTDSKFEDEDNNFLDDRPGNI